MGENKRLRWIAVEKTLWELPEVKACHAEFLREIKSYDCNVSICDTLIMKIPQRKAENNKVNQRKAENNREREIYNDDECLAIGVSSEFCQNAIKTGVACLLYESDAIPRQSHVTGLSYVLQSFADVSMKYLTQVFCRFHKLPCTIEEGAAWILREITVEDVEKLWECYAQCGKMHISPLADSLEEEIIYTEAYIRHMYGFFGYGMWVGFWKETNELFCRIGFETLEMEQMDKTSKLYAMAEKSYGAQVGYVLRPDYRKKGLAQMLLQKVLQYGFRELGFEWIAALIHPDNEASIKTAKKAGMIFFEEIIYKKEKMLVYILRTL